MQTGPIPFIQKPCALEIHSVKLTKPIEADEVSGNSNTRIGVNAGQRGGASRDLLGTQASRCKSAVTSSERVLFCKDYLCQKYGLCGTSRNGLITTGL